MLDVGEPDEAKMAHQYGYITPHHLSSEKPGSIFLHKRIFRMVAPRLFSFPHLYSSRGSRSLPIFIAFAAFYRFPYFLTNSFRVHRLFRQPSFTDAFLMRFQHNPRQTMFRENCFLVSLLQSQFCSFVAVNWFKITHVFPPLSMQHFPNQP